MNNPQRLLYDQILNERMYRLIHGGVAKPEAPGPQKRLRHQVRTAAVYVADAVVPSVFIKGSPAKVNRDLLNGTLRLKPVAKHFFIEYSCINADDENVRVGLLFDVSSVEETYRWAIETQLPACRNRLAEITTPALIERATKFLDEAEAQGINSDDAIESITMDDHQLWNYLYTARECARLEHPDYLDHHIAELEQEGIRGSINVSLYMAKPSSVIGPTISEHFYIDDEGKVLRQPETRMFAPVNEAPPDDRTDGLLDSMRPGYVALSLLANGNAHAEWFKQRQTKTPYRLIVPNNKEDIGWPSPSPQTTNG